jgi:hypothetical protein
MQGSLEAASRRIHDWCAQVGEKTLFEVLQGARDRTGTSFHMEVADQIRRRANSCAPSGATGGAGAYFFGEQPHEPEKPPS